MRTIFSFLSRRASVIGSGGLDEHGFVPGRSAISQRQSRKRVAGGIPLFLQNPGKLTASFPAVIALALLGTMALWAGAAGSLLGTVTDPGGAAVAAARVTATETATGVAHTLLTDAQGFYSFQSLPVGYYDVLIDASGFRPLKRTGVVLDVDRKVVVDASLTIGERTEAITVSASATHVETADAQMGEVITGKQMTSVPLNGRSYTDLLALQSGVVPVTSLTSDTMQDVGVSAFSPSGDLNPGTISINGQREFANSFVLNGSDVEEDVNMGTAIVPNLDSIAEFRFSRTISTRNTASSAADRSR